MYLYSINVLLHCSVSSTSKITNKNINDHQREIVFVGFLFLFTMQVRGEQNLNLFRILSGMKSTINLWSKYFQSINSWISALGKTVSYLIDSLLLKRLISQVVTCVIPESIGLKDLVIKLTKVFTTHSSKPTCRVS